MFRISYPKEIVKVSLHMFKVSHLLEKGGGMPGIVGVILDMLRVPHLLEKEGRMPHLGRQMVKVHYPKE